VAVINGRLGAGALRRYMILRRTMKKVAHCLTLVCVQTRVYAGRYRAIGVPEERILITGNVKFDGLPEQGEIDRTAARRALGIPRDVRVFTAGSTRPGEEEIIAEAFSSLRGEVPDAVLVIAPRHPNRASDVALILERAGLPHARRSFGETLQSTGAPVLLLDTMGELLNAFAASDAAFIGGSLCDLGGHNPMEPAALGIPVLFGRFMRQSGARELVEGGAALAVSGLGELSSALLDLMTSDSRRLAMAGAGPVVVSNFKGALSRTIDELEDRGML
jgi:3-deoxy-D-manno-octulosonic-acid transferase